MNKTKHILIYNSNEPFPEQGGMERVTDLLARGLARAGYEVTLLYRTPNRQGRRYEAPTPIFRLPKKAGKEYFRSLLRERGITHVIDQTEGGIVGRFGLFRKRSQIGIPICLIAVQHSSVRAILDHFEIAFAKDFGCSLPGRVKQVLYDSVILRLREIHSRSLTRKLFRDLIRNYDRIVPLSAAFVEDFCHFYPPADRARLTAIPDPNTYEKCERSTHENRVLFVGRLQNRVKGVDKLLRIWSRVEPRFPEWSLDIVGDGEDRGSLERQARELSLQRVQFHGFRNPEAFYRRASVFCMTSVFEGFGMVLTEAMQHGVVPMAFESYGSVRDIIDDGQNGILVPAFDEEGYARELSQLLQSPERRERMAAAALEKSRIFSRENIIDRWQVLLEQCDEQI